MVCLLFWLRIFNEAEWRHLAYNMAASITVHMQIFKCQQLPHFSTDLDETDIKTNGLLRSFI